MEPQPPNRDPYRDDQVRSLIAALILLVGTIVLGLLGIEFPWVD